MNDLMEKINGVLENKLIASIVRAGAVIHSFVYIAVTIMLVCLAAMKNPMLALGCIVTVPIATVSVGLANYLDDLDFR